MNQANIIIIGMGLHAQKSYLPTVYMYKEEYGINIVLGVDLKRQEAGIREYLIKNGMNDLQTLFIDEFEPTEQVPLELQNYLSSVVKRYNVNGVIISTEPLYHKVYAKWALENGLNIMMDKPITGRKNVVSSMVQAQGIYDDYRELNSIYRELQEKQETICSVNVQRRYHRGFRKVIELIKETANMFDAPVTSIQSMHADGQWRLPDEIVEQEYHPYCQGYGKCSHSGYHIFDIVSEFYKAGYREGKFADTAEIMTSFIQPGGFVKQFNDGNYQNYFGKNYSKVKKRDTKELLDSFRDYGEMDAFTLLKLKQFDHNICNVSINLLHNSFARRSWIRPGKDLYKGNGRVKHESHVIQQGPFQCIQVHSYQSNDKHDISTKEDDLWGGNNHFDIFVFRNSDMYGKGCAPLKQYSLRDKELFAGYDENDLVHNISKEFSVLEFIKYIRGDIHKSQLISNIDDHALPVKIMSSIYKSHINTVNGLSPVIKFDI